jgi:8-oxo-dGTP diphosphatase
MALPLREAVRAVVIDDHGQLLLVRFQSPDGTLWLTPGGGIENGESHRAAIRRELHEEVGLEDPKIGPAIWRRVHIFPASSEFGGQRETFYLVRVHEATGSPSFSDEELLAEGLIGSRWWTLAELRDSDDRFAPMSLADLYESLLTTGPPAEPIDVGE